MELESDGSINSKKMGQIVAKILHYFETFKVATNRYKSLLRPTQLLHQLKGLEIKLLHISFIVKKSKQAGYYWLVDIFI